MGARPPDAHAIRDSQYGTAATLLQPTLPGVQQQGQQPLGPCLHTQQHRSLLPQPQGGPQTGEPESLLESGSTEHRGDGGKRLSRGAHQDMRGLQGRGQYHINTSDKPQLVHMRTREYTWEQIVCTLLYLF